MKKTPLKPFVATSAPNRRALNLEDAAGYLSVSPSTLRRLVEKGAIVPSRLSKRLLFDVRDLDELLEQGKR